MTEFDFAERLAFSKGVRERTDIETLRDMISGCERVDRAREVDDRKGVDYWAHLFGGRALGIDAKARELGASRYWTDGEPDLALERWSVVPDDLHPNGVPGWTVDPAKLTDLILFTFDESDTTACYLVGLPQLRLAFLKFGQQWRRVYRYATQTTRNRDDHGFYRSACLFVPATVVLEGMRQVAVGTVHTVAHGASIDEPPAPAPADTDMDDMSDDSRMDTLGGLLPDNQHAQKSLCAKCGNPGGFYGDPKVCWPCWSRERVT
jgi:hypothetical protein